MAAAERVPQHPADQHAAALGPGAAPPPSPDDHAVHPAPRTRPEGGRLPRRRLRDLADRRRPRDRSRSEHRAPSRTPLRGGGRADDANDRPRRGQPEAAMSVPPMYLDPTDENARRLFQRGIEGPLLMLNLLRFREIADYSGFPD